MDLRSCHFTPSIHDGGSTFIICAVGVLNIGLHSLINPLYFMLGCII